MRLISQFDELNDLIINFNKEDKYLAYYDYLIDHFKKINLDLYNITIGMHIIYGWMPRIIPSNINEDYVKLINILIDRKNEIDDLVNNNLICENKTSWIGTSKLMHFIEPEYFPIWDSNVSKNFNVKKYKINNYKIYFDYINWIHENKSKFENLDLIKKNPRFKKLTDIRIIEMILFYFGKSQK